MTAAIRKLPIPQPVTPFPRPEPDAGQELLLARGDTLFFAEDAGTAFFEILSGTIRCCHLARDGRRQVFRFAGAGDLLGISVGDVFGYNAEAVARAVVRQRRLDSLEVAMDADAGLRRQVVRALRDELVAMRTQMMLLGRMSATERLASFLLMQREREGDGRCVQLPMTRSDIADYLGLALETVSRKFGELASHGVIRLETPHRIRITDPDRLVAMAEAN